VYPIGQGSFSDGMPLGIGGTFNFMLVFQAEHNILKHDCLWLAFGANTLKVHLPVTHLACMTGKVKCISILLIDPDHF